MRGIAFRITTLQNGIMETHSSLDITWQSVWRIATVVVVGVIVYAGLDVILGFFLAIVIAAGLDGPITWLQKKRIPRVVGTLMVFITGFIMVAALIYAVVPLAISQFTTLFTQLTQLKAGNTGSILGIVQVSQVITIIIDRFNDLANTLITGNVSLLSIASFFLGGAFTTIAIMVLSFYLTVGQDGVERFILAVVPSAYEDYALDLYFRVRHKIGKWLKAQIILSVIVFLLVLIGLWLLDVQYALLIALFAGMFEIIPFVGPIFSGTIAVLLSLSNSFATALYVLALFVIIHQVENHVLVPTVMRLTTSLNPAVVIVALVLGGAVFGFVGLILAVPAAVLLQEVTDDWTLMKAKQKKRGLGL